MVKKQKISIDPFSSAAVRLTMYYNDHEVAMGSGVLWQTEVGISLVTAWHCLTGTHPSTRQSLSKSGVRPNRVKVQLLTSRMGETLDLNQNLYSSDNQTPAWFVHTLGSRAIDIAVLPLSLKLPKSVISQPVNKIHQTEDIAIPVGSELFIIGFPRNLHRLNLPIWKRASLALEPQALFDGPDGRHLLVDTATREGISGGVVIARYSMSYLSIDGGTRMGGGPHTKIVGIYSGRVGSEDQFAAQIGIVWPINYVVEIMDSGIIDRFI